MSKVINVPSKPLTASEVTLHALGETSLGTADIDEPPHPKAYATQRSRSESHRLPQLKG
ncbi:MAG: hypothetical protein AB7W28_01695 [Armatimonadota bacterium]